MRAGSSGTISTPKLLLRPLLPGDAADLHAIVSNWNVARMLETVPWPYTLDDATAFIAHARMRTDEGDEMHFAIIPKSESVSGLISLVDLKQRPRVGFFLAEEVWGKGLMSDALRALCSLAFDRLHIETMVSGVFDDNPGSLRVHEKCGFQTIGRTRQLCLPRGELLNRIDLELTMRQRDC